MFGVLLELWYSHRAVCNLNNNSANNRLLRAVGYVAIAVGFVTTIFGGWSYYKSEFRPTYAVPKNITVFIFRQFVS
jgi:hypothetical protein